MRTKEQWIEYLNMQPHPEGGYYSVTYASPYSITSDAIDADFNGKRTLATSIYFLIDEGNVSNFHRLKADEIWYFNDGDPLTIAMIDENGNYTSKDLGLNISEGQQPQLIVPANVIFGSYPKKGFSLVSCMVSYGFDFEDFELFTREELLKDYPNHQEIITKLTKA